MENLLYIMYVIVIVIEKEENLKVTPLNFISYVSPTKLSENLKVRAGGMHHYLCTTTFLFAFSSTANGVKRKNYFISCFIVSLIFSVGASHTKTMACINLSFVYALMTPRYS